jgi:hypothetical protein
MALTGGLFQADLQDFLFAVRLATVFQFAILAVIIYLFVKREAGPLAGALACVLTVFSPQLFANSLLATYDLPTALLWTATTFAFYRAMTSRRWAVISGLLFGLALLTKVNAFFLPLALWPWGLFCHRRKALPAILSMALIGPIVFYAGWPWLWLHPFHNLARYLNDKVQPGGLAAWLAASLGATGSNWRQVIPTLYFGEVPPNGVPWHYPFVLTLFTTPLAALAGSAGTVTAARRDSKAPLVALLWWSVLVQLLVFAFLMKPYDGIRLFLPVVPLISAAAGIGLAALARRGRLAAVVVIALVIISPCAEFFIYEPYGLSCFTPLVGGLPGAQRLGMEVTYYGEAVTPAEFAAINSRARDGERIAYAPMFKNLPWLMPDNYVRYGYLKLGLIPASPSDAWDYLIFVNRGGSITPADREALAKGDVIGENRLLGVTLSQVLARRREPKPNATNAPGKSGD